MVVLELEGHTNMLGSGPNQYLQPDYMSPLASPLDSKVSPLALLAQTCSQIGADSHSSKSMFDASKRKLSTCSESSLKSESSSSDSSSKETHVTTNNNKESRGGGSTNQVNNSNRPKSGSSSVSPMTKSSGGGGKSSPVLISPNASSSPAFKPYDMASKPSMRDPAPSDKSVEKHLKATKHNSISRSSANVSPKVKTPNSRSSPENSSSSTKEISVTDLKSSGNSSKGSSGGSGSTPSNPPPETSKSSSSSDHGASPIIRSGLEVLQQGQYGSQSAIAEYNRKLSALSSLSALGAGYPPGFDPMNPAFRPPFMGPPHPHHAMGYAIPGGSPYVSYSRVKTASGAETIVPVCKDPYCTGCQYGGGGVPHGSSGSAGHLSASAGAAAAASTMNGLMAAAAGYPSSLSGGIPVSGATSNSSSMSGLICPAGCVSCDHPKLPLSSLSHLFPPGLASSIASGGYPSSLLSQHVAAASQAQQNAQRPYVCNWIVGDNYCGKRFPSSEELLQHLRTHTNSSGATANSASSGPIPTSAADSAVLAAMVQQQNQLALGASPSSSMYSSALLNPSAMAAAMHRTYPTPPLSPLSAARYHPYAAAMAGKASALSAGLIPSHVPPSSSVAAAAALSNYYAAALYGQRLGPSVHP